MVIQYSIMYNLYSEEDLHNIYLKHVKLEESYFKKYEKFPNCPISSWNYNWGDNDITRAFVVLDFIEWVKKHDISSKNLGYTCTTDPELEFLPHDKKTLIEYPPNDLHTIKYDKEFDFFIFNQTIEHLYNPFIAIKNIFNSLKEGGYVFTSVPTINIPHMTPIHYNGYNPMGLALLFLSCGFEIVEIGQFGNFRYIQHIFANHSWIGYNNINVNGNVENEERNVACCWILARRPL